MARSPGDLSDNSVMLDADETHHAQRVLRLVPGGAVELFDGRGLVAVGKWQGDGQVGVEKLHELAAPVPAVDVATAWPKAGRANDMIAALSQLGADRVIPLKTQRSMTHPSAKRIERLGKLTIESAKQCRRAHLLSIAAMSSLQQVLADKHDLRLIARPDADDTLPADISQAQRVLIVIGPEGGWTEAETALAQQHRCVPWRLGPHVLRIETAAAAAVALVRCLAQSAL